MAIFRNFFKFFVFFFKFLNLSVEQFEIKNNGNLLMYIFFWHTLYEAIEGIPFIHHMKNNYCIQMWIRYVNKYLCGATHSKWNPKYLWWSSQITKFVVMIFTIIQVKIPFHNCKYFLMTKQFIAFIPKRKSVLVLKYIYIYVLEFILLSSIYYMDDN